MSQETFAKRFQRIFTIVSALAFAGSTIFAIAAVYSTALKEPNPPVQSEAQIKNAQLAKQAQGYELVLTREPNNQAALQALVQIRLQMNDLQGAVEPMEKLVKLNPDRKDYQTLLAAIKQREPQPQKTPSP